MAKNYFDRYVWLIDVINRHGHITKKELDELWYRSPLNEKRDKTLPERTFHNHRVAILDTFGIELKCDRTFGYYIANGEDLEGDSIREWLFSSMSMSNLLKEGRDMRDRILFEKIPSSQRWLSVILNAMRDGRAVEVTYQSFWSDEPGTFTACPYCLKLFRQRWYMLAYNVERGAVRTYALDERTKEVRQTDERFKIPAKFNAEQFFSEYFGIIVGTDWAPQEVKIKVVNDQVKYFDSLPLHNSQRKVAEESNENYTVYHYHLAPTFDFKQELLSRGPAVQVLAPEAFRLEVMDDVAAMAKNYGL